MLRTVVESQMRKGSSVQELTSLSQYIADIDGHSVGFGNSHDSESLDLMQTSAVCTKFSISRSSKIAWIHCYSS